MRTLHCSCCGEEVTMPQWNAGQPYGYTCFARLFGKNKASRYVPVEGWVRIIRRWDDHLANMSPEGIKDLSGKAMINFSHPAISPKKLIGATDHAIQDSNGSWWIPEADMTALLKQARKKFIISTEELANLLKGVGK